MARAHSSAFPDAGTLRRIIRNRQLRAECFGSDLFADPVWDMLLDLAAARIERRRVSVSSLCLASGVPSTTALRWIRTMEASNLIRREDDEIDRRRSYLALSDRAFAAMARYFAVAGARPDLQH